MDIDGEQYYKDLEVDDYNKLFRHDNLITQKFGKTIKVTIDASSSEKVTRKVEENLSLVSAEGEGKKSPSKGGQD